MSVTQTVVREFEADLVVRAVDVVAKDVVALTLARPDGEALPAWTPGAHIDLVLDEDLVRQYSLCGRTEDTDAWRVAVLREPTSRGGSERVHQLAAGDAVRVRGPRNHFPVVAATSYLFVAGGIGITPLLPMISEVDASGADWQLYYGGRTRESMAFAEELAKYGDRVHLVPQDEQGMLDLDAILGRPRPGTLVYTCGPEPLLAAVEERGSAWLPGSVHLVPQDEQGMLDLDAILGRPRPGTLVYTCGPEPLLAAVEERGSAWLPGSVHLERFAARAQAGDTEDVAFDVELQRSGKTVHVPAGRSIFEVVREAGVSVLGSCLEGICGTCETEVVEGEIDHRDSVLDEAEREAGETMMICVSRCTSGRLTLDL